MEKIEVGGFIVQDRGGAAIYSTGATALDAWSNTIDAVGSFHDQNGESISEEKAKETQFLILPATKALLDLVRAEGGAISWTVSKGIAHIREG